jgi:hypothetical protein
MAAFWVLHLRDMRLLEELHLGFEISSIEAPQFSGWLIYHGLHDPFSVELISKSLKICPGRLAPCRSELFLKRN